MYLSKSLYIRGLQCKKSLWLKIHNPSVLAHEDNQSRFETGNNVGLLARQLFPNGKEIQLSTPIEQISKTQEHIQSGVKTIYEATFEFNNVMIMIDILHIDENGGFNIFEVKSSTKVKETHKNDVSIQYFVMNGLGYNINSCNVIFINNKYVREDELDIKEFFQIRDISEVVLDLQSDIPANIESFKSALKESEIEMPIGKHCHSPYKCEAIEYCWKHIPHNSIFNITGFKMDKKMELYSQKIITVDQIKDFSDFTKSQLIQIESELSQKVYMDKKAISTFLKSLSYPIYHLDFESYQQAIPELKDVKPFMNIPFQYSLHIEQENGDLEHKEFLAIEGGDPRYKLATKLIEDIPKDVIVLAYNMTFEKGIIKNLAQEFQQYSHHLMAIYENVRDLMPTFKNKHYYSPEMMGRYSIKFVLPALVPKMLNAYKKLDLVHNGVDAMSIFPKLVGMKKKDREKYRTALLKYCELDTLAMVKILEVLKKVV